VNENTQGLVVSEQGALHSGLFEKPSQASSPGLRHGASLLSALLLHGGLAWLGMHAERPVPKAPPVVTEVSLMPAPAPPPPPPAAPVVEPPPPPAAPEPRAARPRAPAPAKAPEAAAASAAPLLTAPESAPDSQEPVRFVSDPNGTAFGYGIVARGGTAREGRGSSTAPQATVAAAPKADPNAPYRGALGRPARLPAFDPCRGFFPGAAQADRGESAVRVTVAADGRVAAVAVLAERPTAQGFGAAARACLLAARFEPALDTEGRPVVTVAPITVKFSR
jgi:TonB family protein